MSLAAMMELYFSGQPRLRLFFDTPNQCGAAMGMVSCAATAFFCRWTAGTPARRWWLVLWSLLIALLFVLLARTYSRGAYVAVAGALGGLAMIDPQCRRRMAWPLAALVLTLWAIPAGWDRVHTLVEPDADASIANRLTLWRGAMAMAWDHFPGGVGLAGFREEYSAWYQATDRFQVYVTGVSDYATLAAAGGLVALALYLGVNFWVLGAGVAALRAHAGPPGLGAALASTVCYLIAAGFSTLLLTPSMAGLFGVSVLAVAVGVRRQATPVWRRAWAPAAGLAGGAALACAVVGFVTARELPTKLVGVEHHGLQPQPRMRALSPRHGASVGTVLVILDRWFPDEDARRLARPLAEAGYGIVLVAPSDFLGEGLRQTQEILARLDARASATQPVLVVGYGEGGRLALLLGEGAHHAHLRGVVAIAATFRHPLPEFSPAARLAGLKLPVLLLHDPDDRLHNPAEARRFQAEAIRAGVPSTWVPCALATEDPAAHWAALREPLLKFLGAAAKEA